MNDISKSNESHPDWLRLVNVAETGAFEEWRPVLWQTASLYPRGQRSFDFGMIILTGLVQMTYFDCVIRLT